MDNYREKQDKTLANSYIFFNITYNSLSQMPREIAGSVGMGSN